jgi:hypothetical protein
MHFIIAIGVGVAVVAASYVMQLPVFWPGAIIGPVAYLYVTS